MAPLPKISLRSLPIATAIAEGRTQDAKMLLAAALQAGDADPATQRLAAELLLPPKRGRGRPATSPQHWLEIAEEFRRLRDDGAKYEEALRRVAEQFGYGETHVRTAVRLYAEARGDRE